MTIQWQQTPLLMLLLQLATIMAQQMYEFPLKMDVQMKNRFNLTVHWDFDWDLQTVTIGVELDADNQPIWALVGFSDHGDINGSDFCMMRDDAVQDGWVDGDGSMMLDRQQDCKQDAILLSEEGKKMFVFTRQFHTCDWKDYAIEDGSTHFIIAIGYTSTMNIFAERAEHQLVVNRLFRQVPSSGTESTVGDDQEKTFEVRSPQIAVPAQETTYWCTVRQLTSDLLDVKHHITMIEQVIQEGHEHLVHHMEVYHCDGSRGEAQQQFSGECNLPNGDKVDAIKYCSRVIAAWAKGAQPIKYPLEAGTPFGGENYHPYVMVEVHYNNQMKQAGMIDSSGFRFHYTSKLRQYDAGIMELGLIYGNSMSNPPGQRHFAHTGYCLQDCTAKLPEGGIRIFGTQLHAHLTGRKLWTSHYRDGVKIGEINRDNHYYPHYQEIHMLETPVNVQPGDLLTTNCIYDTTTRVNITLGGWAITEEMCVNYVHYYPRSEVEVCKSAIDDTALESFFNQIEAGDAQESVATRFERVKWDENAVAKLVELYAAAPIKMDCLQHSGELFPGHPTDWKNIAKPLPRYAPFDTVRANVECPALND